MQVTRGLQRGDAAERVRRSGWQSTCDNAAVTWPDRGACHKRAVARGTSRGFADHAAASPQADRHN